MLPESMKAVKSTVFVYFRAPTKGKPGEPTAEQVYIDMILCRHARKLLASSQIRTLGYFAANMEDFHFVAWLKRER